MKAIASFLAADTPLNEPDARDEFRRRFLGLASEANRRDEITQSKFNELAALVGMNRQEVRGVLESAGFTHA